jgi:iron(III) transport system substrate-binding protein
VAARVQRQGPTLSNRTLSAMEHGRGVPVGYLPDLAAALECTVTYLIGLTDDPARWEPDTPVTPPDAERRGGWILGPHLPAMCLVLVALLALAGCGKASGPADSAEITLYTSVTQNTVDAVVAGFTAAHPGVKVDVFRATTGQLNARIAADQRSGGLRADVIWGTDPLSMQSYADQKLLRPWPLAQLTGVPVEARTPYFWGTRILYVVMVSHTGLTPTPRRWADLSSRAYRGAVALPDPAAAGSAFAAVGYFSQQPGFGVEFYRRLKDNGAVQVSTVPEVVTSVAQGRYKLGVTLDSEIRAAVAKGSPVTMVWPSDGAISLYSPIAETAPARDDGAARTFMQYVLSPDGQRRIASTGWQPIRSDIAGPPKPAGATAVSPDWFALFGKQREILRQYQAIFR